MTYLENFNDKIKGGLELRPHPRAVTIKCAEYPVNDVFYIGMRVNRETVPRKEVIDLSSVRKKFYDFLI